MRTPAGGLLAGVCFLLCLQTDGVCAIVMEDKGKRWIMTWDEYKEQVKASDVEAKRELEEIEEKAAIVTAMIDRRNALGLSQRELAEMCGIPQSSVARIESNRTVPKLDTLLKIFHQLGLQLSVQSVPASSL